MRFVYVLRCDINSVLWNMPVGRRFYCKSLFRDAVQAIQKCVYWFISALSLIVPRLFRGRMFGTCIVLVGEVSGSILGWAARCFLGHGASRSVSNGQSIRFVVVVVVTKRTAVDTPTRERGLVPEFGRIKGRKIEYYFLPNLTGIIFWFRVESGKNGKLQIPFKGLPRNVRTRHFTGVPIREPLRKRR